MKTCRAKVIVNKKYTLNTIYLGPIYVMTYIAGIHYLLSDCWFAYKPAWPDKKISSRHYLGPISPRSMRLRSMNRKLIENHHDSGTVLAGIIMLVILYALSFFMQGILFLALTICIIAATETVCRKRFSSSLLQILYPFRHPPVTHWNRTDHSTKYDV